ncbi:hypothetical protein [Mycobacterium phage Weirdo19]|uniref:Uncharacterized protein n=1 Tax=Mycobacterium phage Weirdo19 TaxID=2601610 RepID=A0A6M2YSR7_9CAUD|nr:hypothetical protein KDJ11_gp47 [Mycobacterium phage Weirdo19]QEA10815.1 hypothetical protein [Mycobacterium phage Weirdo19]
MGWADDPAKVRAAQEAEEEAREQIARRLDAEANKRLTPFERKLLGVLEDIRDGLAAPAAGPDPARLGPMMSGPAVDNLLDSPPEELGGAIEAASYAVRDTFPELELDRAAFDRIAEVAIEAALHHAAQRHQAFVGQEAADDGAAGGDNSHPPAGHPTTTP